MPARRPRFAIVAEPRLVVEPNITPLIDVMLVLLIVMILSVPVATHKVAIDLPAAAPADGAPPPVHRLVLDANGALRWDGASLAEAALPARLAGLHADPRAPELQIAADADAPYGAFDRAIAAVKRAGIARIGIVGGERFAHAF